MVSKSRAEYDPRIIGANLKRLRIERGYSIEDIRQFLCLGTVQAVYKYESGKSLPPADSIFALMELYNVYNISEIIKDTETINYNTDFQLINDSHMKYRLVIYNEAIPKIIRDSAP